MNAAILASAALQGAAKTKMVAGHVVYLRRTREFLANNGAVPRVGSLLIFFSAPQLHGNGDLLQAAGAEQKTDSRRGDDGGFDSRIVNPYRLLYHRVQLVAVMLLDEGALGSVRPRRTKQYHTAQVGRSPNLDKSRESA